MDDAERHDVGEPVVRRQRRRRRDAVHRCSTATCAKYEGMTLTADRQGDGEGSARCGDRSGHRRPRRELRDHRDHGRRRRADGAASIRWSASAPIPARKAEDGRLSESKSHPRAWGSFPRILGHYVRDEHLLTLEEAIRKMTSKAAARVHLQRSRPAAPGHDRRHHRLRSRDDPRRRRRSTIRSTTRSASSTSSSTAAASSPTARSRPSGPAGRCVGRAVRLSSAEAASDSRACPSGSSICSPATATPSSSAASSSRTPACRCRARRRCSPARRSRTSAGCRSGPVIVTAIAGATLGDNLGFFIGRRGGRGSPERHGWRVGLTPRGSRTSIGSSIATAPKTVFVARFITGLRVVGAVLAGASGLRVADVPVLQRHRRGGLVHRRGVGRLLAGLQLGYAGALDRPHRPRRRSCS